MENQYEEYTELSGTEEMWVRAMETGTGCVVYGFQMKRNVTVEEVKKAASATASVYGILAAHIVLVSKGKHEYKLSQGKEKDLISVESLPWPLDSVLHESLQLSDLHKIVELEFGIPFSADPESVPISQIHLYKKAESTILILRIQGSALDRKSVVVIGTSLLSNLNAAVEGTLSHAVTKLSIPPRVTELMPKDIKAKGMVSRGIDSVGYIASALKLALLPFEKGSTDYRKHSFVSQFAVLTLNKQESDGLMATCEKEGSTLFGAECSALLAAVARYKQTGDRKEEYGITSMMDVRSFLEPPMPAQSVGMYCLGLPISCKVSQTHSSQPAGFWEVARSLSNLAEENLKKKKVFQDMKVLDGLFASVLSSPALTPQASLRTSLCSVYTGAPQRVSLAQHTSSLGLQHSIGPLMSLHGLGPCVACLDALKETGLEVALVYASPLFSRETMTELASAMRANLIAASFQGKAAVRS